MNADEARKLLKIESISSDNPLISILAKLTLQIEDLMKRVEDIEHTLQNRDMS